VLRPLTTAALPVGNRKLSYTDATTGVSETLYNDQNWPVLNQSLTKLITGDGSALLALADEYHSMSNADVFTAVNCVDYPPVTAPAALLETSRRSKKAAPFLDDGSPPSQAREACAF
jgi:hypothetical protein